MANAPFRFVNAVLWPVTIWTSLTHLEEHPADDYVERTTPIVACAVGFWVALIGYIALAVFLGGRPATITAEDTQIALRVFDQRWAPLATVLLYFLPVVYVIGFWLFTARDERFPRTGPQHQH
ncbi:MAG: hypothetical protein ABUS57_06370 [Pseudomonadota bacterium]